MFDKSSYDLIVDNKKRLLRVQVKSVSYLRKGREMYGIPIVHGKGKKLSYTKKEIDFIACYVIPEKTWYIIPICEITTSTIGLGISKKKPSSGKYNKYKNNWKFKIIK